MKTSQLVDRNIPSTWEFKVFSLHTKGLAFGLKLALDVSNVLVVRIKQFLTCRPESQVLELESLPTTGTSCLHTWQYCLPQLSYVPIVGSSLFLCISLTHLYILMCHVVSRTQAHSLLISSSGGCANPNKTARQWSLLSSHWHWTLKWFLLWMKAWKAFIPQHNSMLRSKDNRTHPALVTTLPHSLNLKEHQVYVCWYSSAMSLRVDITASQGAGDLPLGYLLYTKWKW